MMPLSEVGNESAYGDGDRFPHITQRIQKGHATTWPFWIERYIKGAARIVFHLRGIRRDGNSVNLCAIFKSHPSSLPCQSMGRMNIMAESNVKPHIHSTSEEIQGVVFVLNVQALQHPERFWRPIPSLIRLQPLNDVLCRCGHAVHLIEPTTPTIPKLSFINENGECSTHVGACSSQFPGQMVKGGTEIVEHIPSKHVDRIGDSVPIYDLRGDISRWNILLSDNFVWADLEEAGDFTLQGLQVFVCPDELHGKASFCRHIIQSDCEDQNAKAENAEGCGNSHSETGRLLQESEESRHAVSVPPSEEVTSQTAPSHPRGDCTATHTRSNNPEGAS
jgi:hypothetical protein